MQRSMFQVWVALVVCIALSVGSFAYAADSKSGDTALKGDALKQACLAATITAIKLEMNRYQRWIDVRKQQGDVQGEIALQSSLDVLAAELELYAAMDAKDYVLPAPMTTVAWVEIKADKDAIVYIDNMSKSGPWYHLAGITGDNYALMRPAAREQVNLYPVHKRTYGSMQSAYVFVEVIKTQAEGKRITGEVFERNAIIPWDNDIGKCDNYQVFLLQEPKPGAPGELLLESKKSSFDITISASKLKKYPYIEIVSAYGSKLLKVSEIPDGEVKIILDSTTVIKKPAIYLYPAQAIKIEVTHSFQGKILNTYPAYRDGWTVMADPQGNLRDVYSNRTYKYLFWDGAYSFPQEHYQYKSGFYVKNSDYVPFLQTKLSSIGLTENEINDFIVYWLPSMSRYNNCFVHFRINDNIGGTSVLTTQPAADTTIRVFMEFSGIDTLTGITKLPEQQLPNFTRKGFTLVEWGGSEVGKGKIE